MKMYVDWVLFLIVTIGSIGSSVSDGPAYNRVAKNTLMNVRWRYDETYVYFKIQCPIQTGWCGMGLNDKASMVGGDFVVGWIDNGNGHIEDRHLDSNSPGEPTLDTKQDVRLVGAILNENGTTIEFKRKIKTCDKQDYTFSQDHTYILYAYSDQVPVLEDGKYKLQFHEGKDWSSPENILSEAQALAEGLSVPPNTDSQLSINFENFTIPPQYTTYWCQIFEIPIEYRENESVFIGWRPNLTEGHEKYFHHAGIGQCRGDPEQLREKVKIKGWECTTPEQFMELLGCLPMLISFVVGSSGDNCPEDISFPFGRKFGGSDFLFYQAHYTNPEREEGIVDSSGVVMYFSKKKTKYTAGTLFSMSSVDLTLVVPPKQPKFCYNVICPTACLSLFDSDVTIFGILPHMHTAGVEFTVHHYDKDGIEKPPIFQDKRYVFNSQDTVWFNKRIQLSRGDSISTVCCYDTTTRDKTTLGGLSTMSEMCASVLYYYPLQKNFSLCSFFPSKNDQAQYFGVTSFNETTLEVNEPDHLKGKKLDHVIEDYPWTPAKAEEYQYRLMNQTKVGACIGVGGITLQGWEGKIKIQKEYKKPKDDCNC